MHHHSCDQCYGPIIGQPMLIKIKMRSYFVCSKVCADNLKLRYERAEAFNRDLNWNGA